MNGAHALQQLLSQALDGSLPGLPGPVHLLGEAVDLSPVTAGLRERHPTRVHLLPAADATLVGVAVGLALSGAVAVVELADPAALAAALPQLVEAATLGGPDFPVRLVVRVPCGPDLAPVPPERLAEALPGLALASAGTAAELAPLLHAALTWGGPVLLLEPRPLLAAAVPSASEPALPLGRARLLRQGAHATVLAWGGAVAAALDAAATLQAEGIEADVVDLRCLRPLDQALVAARVAQTGRVVVAGAADGVLLTAVQQAFLRLESPPARLDARADAPAIAACVRAAVHF